MRIPTLAEHLIPGAPKRILALDGGGVRGILTLAYLQQIESILASRWGDDSHKFRLCHYFDMIGGTSTGAIIAAGLAIGMSVGELQEHYRKLASSVFLRSWFRYGIFNAKFPKAPLETALKNVFGDITLGSDRILTGLVIVAKRLDTGSTWVLHNHPASRYYGRREGSRAYPNKLYLLQQLVRASTAAPHYFEPECIEVAEATAGAFVDGGASPHNNPALQCFMVAAMDGYCWNWPTGADQLLLVSVGTGDAQPRMETSEVMDAHAYDLALRSLMSMMDDSSALVQTILQWISRCPTRWTIDREIGDLTGKPLGGQELLTYVRYNVRFDPTWMATHLDTNFDRALLDGLTPMDNARNLNELERIGEIAAKKQVQAIHLP